MNNSQLIEGIIILLILVLQTLSLYYLIKEINIFKNIFSSLILKVDEFLFEYDILKSYSPDEIIININSQTYKGDILTPKIKKIKLITTIEEPNRLVMNSIYRELNLYLLSQKGSSFDFEYVRNIVESHIDNEEESITSSINNPLYLGLMATLVGIIIGLGSLFLSGNEVLENNNMISFLSNISIAMFSSLLGILFTTILNYSYKRGRKRLIENKIKFLNKLFIELSLNDVEEDTSSILTSLKDNFLYFNLEMENNVKSFSNTVSELKNFLSQNIQENLHKQSEILNKFYELNIPHILDSNLRVMGEFSQSTANLDKFNNYLENINHFIHSSNRLTDQSEKLFEEVKIFGSTIHSNLNNIELHLSTSNSLLNFLDSHKLELQERNDGIKALVNRIDSNIEKGIGKLDEKILKEKETIKETAGEIDSTIRDTLINLKKYTSESIRELQINLKQEEQRVRALLKDSNGNLAQLAYLGKIHDEIQNIKTLEAIQTFQEEQKLYQSDILNEIKLLTAKNNLESNSNVYQEEMIKLLKEIKDQNLTWSKYQSEDDKGIFGKFKRVFKKFITKTKNNPNSIKDKPTELETPIRNSEPIPTIVSTPDIGIQINSKIYSNNCDTNGLFLNITSEKMEDSIYEIQINDSNEGLLNLITDNIQLDKYYEVLVNACVFRGRNKKNPKKILVTEVGHVVLEDGNWKIKNKIEVKLA